MLVVLCSVRSTSTSRSPGPVKSVCRPLCLVSQPGGTSIENPAAALCACAWVTVCVVQSAPGSAVEGLLSASTDFNFVTVSATEGTVVGWPPAALVLPALAPFDPP